MGKRLRNSAKDKARQEAYRKTAQYRAVKQRYRRSKKGRATELTYRKKWEASLNGRFRAKASRLRVLCDQRGVHCDVVGTDLLRLWEKQKSLCALTGRKMVIGDRSADSVSVDRKAPAKGYVGINLRLVTWQANCARGEWSDKALIEFCRDVVRHANSKKGIVTALKLVTNTRGLNHG